MLATHSLSAEAAHPGQRWPAQRGCRLGQPRRAPLRAALDHSEGDTKEDLSAEVARLAQAERAKDASSRLELVWQVSKVRPAQQHCPAAGGSGVRTAAVLPQWQRRKPLPCTGCRGTGLCDCQFCRGSGAMTVGEQVFCSLAEGCRGCPACKRKVPARRGLAAWCGTGPTADCHPRAQGQIKCKQCRGTGKLAGWAAGP